MITITARATRPTAIIRVWATGRVPLGLMPVTAAMAAMTTAMPSHTNQFMIQLATRCAPAELGASARLCNSGSLRLHAPSELESRHVSRHCLSRIRRAAEQASVSAWCDTQCGIANPVLRDELVACDRVRCFRLCRQGIYEANSAYRSVGKWNSARAANLSSPDGQGAEGVCVARWVPVGCRYTRCPSLQRCRERVYCPHAGGI